MKGNKSDENTILDLLETTDFEMLTSEQVELVLLEVTEEDYKLKRTIIQQSAVLFNESDNYNPKPLVIPAKPKTFMTATIPLYQALLSVAAILMFMLLAYPFINVSTNPVSEVSEIRVDTVKTEVVKYDTVEVIVEKPVVEKKIVYVEVPVANTQAREMPRLLEVPQSFVAPNISENTIRTKGVSMKKDSAIINLPVLN